MVKPENSGTLPLYNNGFVIRQMKILSLLPRHESMTVHFSYSHNNRDIVSRRFATFLFTRHSMQEGLISSKGESMQIRKLEAIVLASALILSMSAGFAVAQDGAKQDMKAAGTDTKNATKGVGNGVATGTKKTYNATANGTKTVAHKTANGTKTAADKTADGTKTVGKDVGHGTKAAAEDTAHGTEKLGDKIAGKPTPQ
jgi:hypothetical protein